MGWKPARIALKTLLNAFIVVLVVTFFLSNPSSVNAAIGDWQKGFTLRLNNQTTAEVDVALTDLKNTGADYVTISPGWLTDNKFSSNVVRKDRTPSDALVRHTIRKAKSLGLKVMLKPHLDRKDGGWRAFIDPNDKSTFFKNYSAMMLLYTDIAAQEGVDMISVGAELWKLSTNPSNEKYWEDMIAEMRKRFNGKLTYSANSDSDFYDEGGLTFWDKLDYWGSSMYISVAKDNNPTREWIMQEWQWAEDRYYKPMSQKIGLPLLATEIGYRSVDGAGQNPEVYSESGKVDLQEQALLYEMFFEFWKNKSYFHGVHFWEWEAGQNVGGTNNNNYTPQGKPAQDVVRQYFTSAGSSGSSTPPSFATTSGVLFTNVKASNGFTHPVNAFSTGVAMYSDRTYTVSGFPSYLSNGEYIQTRNIDKGSTSATFLTFDLKKASDIYVAYDSRAASVPNWLSGWPKAAGQIQTSDAVFNLYKKSSVSGSHSLGGNMASGASGAESNYYVLAVELPTTSLPPSGSVQTLYFENVVVSTGSIYEVKEFTSGAEPYTDRNYSVTGFPDFLAGSEYIKTKNGDKNATNSTFLTFNLKDTVDLYVAYDSRAGSIPGWLSAWENTGYLLETTDASFKLYRKATASGIQSLGGNMAAGASGAQSNYFVFATKSPYVPIINNSNTSTNPDAQNNTGSPSEDTDASSSESETVNGLILVDHPVNGQWLSGEKKLKFYIKNVKPDTYDGYYSVDGQEKVLMQNSDPYKQLKVQFDNWKWNGTGPYTITFYAYNKGGTLIDTATIQIFVKQ